MSNVAIVATGEVGLEVDVCLGDTVRKSHKVDAGGDALELTVAGNQTLSVRASSEAAPTAEAEGDIPIGADVSDETDADGQPNPPTSEDRLTPTEESRVETALAFGAEQDGNVAPAADAVVDESKQGEQLNLFENPFETEGKVE